MYLQPRNSFIMTTEKDREDRRAGKEGLLSSPPIFFLSSCSSPPLSLHLLCGAGPDHMLIIFCKDAGCGAIHKTVCFISNIIPFVGL